jgi:arginine decarboxylase
MLGGLDLKMDATLNYRLPTKFYVTSGKSVSEVSELNAFDQALCNANIAEYNLVRVSSVLPAGTQKMDELKLPTGSILYTVLAQMNGDEGETISAGIAYAFRKDGKGGYVAEGHGHLETRAMREILEWKMGEMASHRGVELGGIDYLIEELSVPMDHYGACVAALALL